MRTERTTNNARGAGAVSAAGSAATRTAGAAAILAVGAVLVSVGAVGAGAPVASGAPDVPHTPRAGALNALQDTVSFADDVLPIFRQRCAECHGAEDENGEVRVEVSLNLLNHEGVMAGSEFGTVVEAGDPANSFLLDMIVDGTMPEQGDPVPEEEIAIIRAWIEAGAPNN